VTSIEFDHADIYDSIDKIFSNFKKLVEITTDKVILCLDFEHNRKLAPMIPEEKLFTYSVEDESADAFAFQKCRDGNRMVFCVKFKDGKEFEFKTPFFGKQNLMNLGALVSFLKLEGEDLNSDTVKKAFLGMKGIKRRQELLGKINDGLIYSDFAHHPTAVDLTFDSFRDFFPEKEIYVIFDPATNSNNQNIFEDQYIEIFKKADKVVIGHPPKLDKFPPELRFSPQRVISSINSNAGKEKAFYLNNIEDIIKWVETNSSEKTVTVVMSNSGFYDFFTKIKPIVE
jgi:UDP-N-acetylmuramate: L-alanyl-gamma-D-glutamyl-meso-diaminopimelate ligase